MNFKTLTMIAVVASGMAVGAQAQGDIPATPVNFPPASFKGSQFADARGCVFVRAGFDGNVTWVPRVSRQRQQICGQTPTSFGGAPAAPARSTADAPVQITPAAPPAAASEPAPRSTATAPAAVAPRSTPAAVAPAPARRAAPAQATTARVLREAPEPVAAPRRVVRVPASKPVAAEPPRMVRRVPAPPAATVVKEGSDKRYHVGRTVKVPAQIACENGQTSRVVDGRSVKIRCGPQSTPHVTIVRRGEAPGPGKNVHYNRSSWDDSRVNLPGDTRIVPRHVYEERDTQVAHVPEGYRPAWDDDRLNRHRALMTVDGFYDTQEVWTNTVPRKLVVQPRRHKVKDPVIAYRASGAYPQTAGAAMIATKGAPRAPVISGKGQAASGRWVEIGAFSSAAGAEAAARRLISAGLPVKMTTYRSGGQQMRKLRVGPYASAPALGQALRRVQGTGYVQAYIR